MSLHYDILSTFVTRIKALDLVGVECDYIKVLKTDAKRQQRQDLGGYPGVGVFHDNLSEIHDLTLSTNLFNYIGYPVIVSIVDNDRGDGTGDDYISGQPDQVLDHDPRLTWRESILGEFLGDATLTETDPTICDIVLEQRQIMRPRDWLERGFWVSDMAFRCWAYVAR